jgi:Apea-like HEPN
MAHGLGVLRCDLDIAGGSSDTGHRDRQLVWPMLYLNLISSFPVQVGFVFLTRAGRTSDDPQLGTSRFRPAEARRWGISRDLDGWRRHHRLNELGTGRLESLANGYGESIARLDRSRADQLARAADQFLTVTFRGNWHSKRRSSLDIEEADDIFRLIAAIEGLLTGEDGDHNELTRKVAQRAAILAGKDSRDRIAVHDSIRTAYAARSAHVHRSKPKTVDLTGIHSLTRRVLHAWPLVASQYNKGRLPKVLDEALLSSFLFERNILPFAKSALTDGSI